MAAGSGAWKGHVGMLVCTLMAALMIITMKKSLSYFKPEVFAGVRALLTQPMLIVLTVGAEHKDLLSRDEEGLTVWWKALKNWKSFLALGFIGVYINQLFVILGLKVSTATNAILVAQLAPVITTVLSVVIRIESLSFLKVAGMVVAFCGVLFLVDIRSFDLASVGNILFLINTTAYACYLVMQKLFLQSRSFPPLFVAMMVNMTGCVFMTLTSIVMIGNQPNILELPAVAWAYGLLVGSLAAMVYVLITACLKLLSPVTISIYGTLNPLVGGVLAYLILGEEMTLKTLAGGILIVSGVVSVLYAKAREDPAGAAGAGKGSAEAASSYVSIAQEKEGDAGRGDFVIADGFELEGGHEGRVDEVEVVVVNKGGYGQVSDSKLESVLP